MTAKENNVEVLKSCDLTIHIEFLENQKEAMFYDSPEWMKRIFVKDRMLV